MHRPRRRGTRPPLLALLAALLLAARGAVAQGRPPLSPRTPSATQPVLWQVYPAPKLRAGPEGAVQEGVRIFSGACQSPGGSRIDANKSPALLVLRRPRIATAPGPPALPRVIIEAKTCAPLQPLPLCAKCAVRGGLRLQSALGVHARARVYVRVTNKKGKSHLMHT
ncbi:hypothetical protein H8959_005387 [Pygathrix nigripes]